MRFTDTTKPTVRKNTMTGHWIVDESGLGRTGSSSKGSVTVKVQGWRSLSDALADAASKVKHRQRPDGDDITVIDETTTYSLSVRQAERDY